MNEKCKYCDYVLKCSRFCEYNSIMCLIHRSFPKIVDKTYEELEKENKKYKEVINKLRELIGKHYFKQSDDYYDYFTEGVCLQDGDYQELEDILKEVE